MLSVIDGDTAKVLLSSGPINVRFHLIDAPEKDQPGGMAARVNLAQRIERKQVYLEVKGQDRYERLVAEVYLGDENINAWLVQNGYAWAYRQYMDDPRYCDWEHSARTNRLGLWSTSPQYAPWEWRANKRDHGATGFIDYSSETAESCRAAMHQRRTPQRAVIGPAAPPTTSDGTCRIKGNISDSGRIYHVPGSASYDRTIIDESKGERWFCTEEEARAAGWRAPR